MSRYISDQNKVVMLYESGTYANSIAGGKWIGQVQDFSIDDSENLLQNRYLGNSSRSVGKVQDGPRDVTGTMSYHPVDMNLIAHAIGSVSETSGTSYTHNATEIESDVNQNPFTSGTGQKLDTPYSVTFEDSKQSPGTGRNFIRTINGAVFNTITVNSSQGEKVSVDVDWVGQTLSFSSGTTTAVTAVTQRAYSWNDCSLTMAGSSIDTTKSISLEINQGINPPHYLNGSRDIASPFPGERSYTLTVTADLDSDTGQFLYNNYYKGGSEINSVFDMNADSTGSQHAIFTLSGARITSMEMPSTIEGVNETTIELQTGSLDLVDYTNPSQIGSYNPF